MKPAATRTARIELRVTQEFLDRIETWRQKQPGPPSKTAAILYLLSRALDIAELPEPDISHLLKRRRRRASKE